MSDMSAVHEARRQALAKILVRKAIAATGDMYMAMADFMIERLDEKELEAVQAVEIERQRCLEIVRCYDALSGRWSGLPIEPDIALHRIRGRIGRGWTLAGAVAELTKGPTE